MVSMPISVHGLTKRAVSLVRYVVMKKNQLVGR